MAIGNGITVRLKGADGLDFDEVKSNNEEPHYFRYRLIRAIPRSKFEVSVTIGEPFDWKDADCIFVAIAHDDGVEEHLESIDYTMAWAISRTKNHQSKQLFTRATSCEKDEPNATLLKTAYYMPTAATGVSSIKADKLRHLSKSTLVSHRSCISVYVHRGRLISNPTKRRPADPVSNFLESTIANIAKSTARRLKINFESFKPLSGTDGNVCEFHFRNIIGGEYMKHKARASTKATSKDAGSATPTNDRRTTRGATAAKRKRPLRDIPRRDYSLTNLLGKTGYESDDNQMESEQEETEADWRSRPGCRKRRMVSLGNEEDETEDEDDDEVIVIEDPRKVLKTEPGPKEQAPVQPVEVQEEQLPAPSRVNTSDNGTTKADTDGMTNGTVSGVNTQQNRKLDMDLEEIELEEKELELEKKTLELKKRKLDIKRRKLDLGGD